MGCFDEALVRCPCGGRITFQTKAGRCEMRTYELHRLPPVLAGDLDGETAQCPECGKTATIHTQVLVTATFDGTIEDDEDPFA